VKYKLTFRKEFLIGVRIGINRLRTCSSTETEQYGFNTEEKIKEGHRSNGRKA